MRVHACPCLCVCVCRGEWTSPPRRGAARTALSAPGPCQRGAGSGGQDCPARRLLSLGRVPPEPTQRPFSGETGGAVSRQPRIPHRRPAAPAPRKAPHLARRSGEVAGQRQLERRGPCNRTDKLRCSPGREEFASSAALEQKRRCWSPARQADCAACPFPSRKVFVLRGLFTCLCALPATVQP